MNFAGISKLLAARKVDLHLRRWEFPLDWRLVGLATEVHVWLKNGGIHQKKPRKKRKEVYLVWKHGMMCQQTLLSFTFIFVKECSQKLAKNMKVETPFQSPSPKKNKPSQSFQVTHQLPHNHQGVP